MMAVAEVNGAVMNNPELLRGFEDLFRTKIRIAQDNARERDTDSDRKTDDEYRIAQDRMGLASLLTDQMKYQEAADELELAVRSLSAILAAAGDKDGEKTAATATATADATNSVASIASLFDKASSLLFRTRAMICDWNNYEESSASLVAATRRALASATTTTPAVHPFEALTWPSLSLGDATGVAHAYGARAMKSSLSSSSSSSSSNSGGAGAASLPWTNLKTRLPRTNVPFVRAVTTTTSAPMTSTSGYNESIIRVGYLSPDFNGKHPLSFLMQDVFRFHNAERFDVRLYSLGGEADSSPEVQKIVGNNNGNDGTGNDRSWTTLEGSVPDMARTIRDDQLDVLIDLCGYTGTSLVAEVMACLRGTAESQDNNDNPNDGCDRHPVHVAYMGFPGSSGAPFIDYMIADEVVIPSKYRPWYTENILYMPHCYFVNSHKHILPNYEDDRSSSISSSNRNNAWLSQKRSEYGLPPDPETFVFCCHSRPDKIDPETFATWIRALKRTRKLGLELGRPDMANAVLWLLRSSDGSDRMEANLRNLARSVALDDRDGINDNDNDSNNDSDSDNGEPLHDCAALVFCDHAPRHEHLSRLALADLFLDTPAYNAHTVGCDCLSAGVPMLSLLRPMARVGVGVDACNSNNHNNNNNNKNDDDRNETNKPAKVPTEKLASRVGASLLRSAEGKGTSILSDRLVVSSMKEYEDRMVECALEQCSPVGSSFSSPSLSLLRLKDHLLAERDTAPLWDTERWVRNLETGLTEMVERNRSGANEADIYVMDYGE